MNGQGAEFVEIFLQEASERLQFLREYSGILQDAYPRQEDVERLHIAAHTLLPGPLLLMVFRSLLKFPASSPTSFSMR